MWACYPLHVCSLNTGLKPPLTTRLGSWKKCGLIACVKVDTNYFCISSFFAVCLTESADYFSDGSLMTLFYLSWKVVDRSIHTQMSAKSRFRWYSSELVIFRSRFIFLFIIVCRLFNLCPVNESISNATPTLSRCQIYALDTDDSLCFC